MDAHQPSFAGLLSTGSTTRRLERLMHLACGLCTWFCLLIVIVLIGGIVYFGGSALSWEFVTSYPSPDAATTGIRVALAGSLWLVTLTMGIAVPIGVGAALYLEEFAKTNRFKEIVRANINNLAGVPSVVYGILGLAVFVRGMQLGHSLIAAALTLALVVLPTIIISSQEAIRNVPDSLRHASYALGASQWQTVRRQVMPHAMPGITTGVILAMARALGEAAPLLVVGAAAYASFTPTGVMDDFSALPLQIFIWATRPQPEFHQAAAAGILVLMAVLLILFSLTQLIRRYFDHDER